jgi:cytochrome c oxidase subunit 3/cytochrome c oxidase subunit I+III
MTSVPYTPRVAKPNGWWGMVLFVATEATLFGTLIGSYYDLRFRTQPWPPAGVPDPKLVLPLILLGVLVATSIPVQLASVWGRARRVRSAQLALLLALAMQTVYLVFQIHLYVDDLDHFTPQGSAYGSIYFTLLGVHHAHVFVGILLEAWLVLRLFGGMTRYRAVGLQATAFYWHAVNVLAVAVTLVQLSPSL